MSPALVDLRPDRHLLDHNFEGYKLNLQSLPHYSYDLESRVDRLYSDEEQFSYPHAELFLLHNHLVLDFWDYSFNYYYIDNNRVVRHISFEKTSNTFQSKVVYDVPITVERKSGHFNPCLSFPSSELAVISDGTGYLHFLNTGPRNRSGTSTPWEAVYTSLVLGDDKYFVIIDTRVQEKNDTLILHCLIKSIEHNYVHYKTVLSWITYSYRKEAWIQTSIKRIEGKGILHYAALETKCEALYIASDNSFKLTVDSEKLTLSEQFERGYPSPRPLLYTWHQSFGDICITMKLEPNFNREFFQCQVGRRTIKVSYAGKDIINSRLMHRVDGVMTTWRILDNGQVDILITKCIDVDWDDLLEYMDENGEQIMDPQMMEETHERLAHLCSEEEITVDHPLPCLPTQQIEECDAPSDEDTILVRMDVTTHEITHRVPLSVNQYLFSIKVEPNEAPALALRHDVDACIWQPYARVTNSKVWPVKHQGTLMAFGYVQASKQNKKFVTCPPDFSYSVVCEQCRHIFIYLSPNKTDGQLRKRTAGVMKPVNVGNQYVFNIEQFGEVVGINATNEFLFILTETKLAAIQVRIN